MLKKALLNIKEITQKSTLKTLNIPILIGEAILDRTKTIIDMDLFKGNNNVSEFAELYIGIGIALAKIDNNFCNEEKEIILKQCEGNIELEKVYKKYLNMDDIEIMELIKNMNSLNVLKEEKDFLEFYTYLFEIASIDKNIDKIEQKVLKKIPSIFGFDNKIYNQALTVYEKFLFGDNFNNASTHNIDQHEVAYRIENEVIENIIYLMFNISKKDGKISDKHKKVINSYFDEIKNDYSGTEQSIVSKIKKLGKNQYGKVLEKLKTQEKYFEKNEIFKVLEKLANLNDNNDLTGKLKVKNFKETFHITDTILEEQNTVDFDSEKLTISYNKNTELCTVKYNDEEYDHQDGLYGPFDTNLINNIINKVDDILSGEDIKIIFEGFEKDFETLKETIKSRLAYINIDNMEYISC